MNDESDLVRTVAPFQLAQRLQKAEAMLADLREVLLTGGQDAGTVRRRAIEIITRSEEGTHRG